MHLDLNRWVVNRLAVAIPYGSLNDPFAVLSLAFRFDLGLMISGCR